MSSGFSGFERNVAVSEDRAFSQSLRQDRTNEELRVSRIQAARATVEGLSSACTMYVATCSASGCCCGTSLQRNLLGPSRRVSLLRCYRQFGAPHVPE